MVEAMKLLDSGDESEAGRGQTGAPSGPWPSWRAVSVSSVAIAGYFVASISLTFFQKRVVQEHAFPITIVLCHLVMKFLYASVCRSAYTWYTARSRTTLDWHTYLKKITAIAATSAFDIGLSQWGLKFVTVSLYTMTKSSSIVFILFFSVIFRLEECNVYLPTIVGAISGGLFLFVYHSTQFHMTGFFLCLTASFMSGARWTISQKVVQKNQLGLSNPIDMIYHIQPLMILWTVPLAAFFEGVDVATSHEWFRFQSYTVLGHLLSLVFMGGSLAFVMEAFEYLVLAKTSSLTLSIIGVVKELTSVALDQAFVSYDHPLTLTNWMGMLVCVIGILLHVVHKSREPSPKTGLAAGSASKAYRRHNRRDFESEYGLPLLGDDSGDLSSDEDFFGNGMTLAQSDGSLVSGKKFQDFNDDFYLRENRSWTGVRDSHMEMKGLDTEDESNVPAILQDQKKMKAPKPDRLEELDFLNSD